MRYVAGVDGGGTHTTVALADERGREIVRREGPAGIVDPRRPEASAAVVAELVREAIREAGAEAPPAALCAGLAGVGNETERDAVAAALRGLGVAELVQVTGDEVIALEGTLGADPGILLIAGTGSVAFGRAEDGRVERCGGWGMIVGDEGSGYAIGRSALRAALQAVDGRGAPTRLLQELLDSLALPGPRAIPSWVGKAEKRDVAALVPLVIRCADDLRDEVALSLLDTGARDLATHAVALAERLGPWSDGPSVVFHGGLLGYARLASRVTEEFTSRFPGSRRRDPAADAVTGALRMARALAGLDVEVGAR